MRSKSIKTALKKSGNLLNDEIEQNEVIYPRHSIRLNNISVRKRKIVSHIQSEVENNEVFDKKK